MKKNKILLLILILLHPVIAATSSNPHIRQIRPLPGRYNWYQVYFRYQKYRRRHNDNGLRFYRVLIPARNGTDADRRVESSRSFSRLNRFKVYRRPTYCGKTLPGRCRVDGRVPTYIIVGNRICYLRNFRVYCR